MSDLSEACLSYFKAVKQYEKSAEESHSHYFLHDEERLERAENNLLDILTEQIEKRFEKRQAEEKLKALLPQERERE